MKDRRCPVVLQLLNDGIIARRNSETGSTNSSEWRTRRFTEPTTGIMLKFTGHGSEIFGGHSDLYRWTPNPNQSNGGDVQREELREDEGVYVEMNEGEGVYV